MRQPLDHKRRHDPKSPTGSPPEDDPWHTTADVARRYRTVPGTVRYWRHIGTGPRGTKFGRKILYRESELKRWERERELAQATA